MAAYLGCATRGNQLKWGLVLFFFLIAVTSFAASFGVATAAYSKYTSAPSAQWTFCGPFVAWEHEDCMEDGLRKGIIERADYDEHYVGRRNSAGARPAFGQSGIPAINDCEDKFSDALSPAFEILWWIMWLSIVIAAVPCLAICFCSKPPEASAAQDVPVAPTYAHGQPVPPPSYVQGQPVDYDAQAPPAGGIAYGYPVPPYSTALGIECAPPADTGHGAQGARPSQPA